MKVIQVSRGLSSGLRPDFNAVSTIELEPQPFAKGGFGEVYHGLSINGKALAVRQVVKLFLINANGSSDQNFKTTQQLQGKLAVAEQQQKSIDGRSILDVYPAFKGIPQFSFEGILNGQSVVGYLADNLVELGFVEFGKMLDDDGALALYQQLDLKKKFRLAYQLVSVFRILDSFDFIHADLKPEALFINLTSIELALIDYDSGVVTESAFDEPLTWGAPNDWVAPEIWEQQKTLPPGELVRVDKYSDRWSVLIGVHYLLTGFHPFFFLTELSPRVMGPYLSALQGWPYADKQSAYFNQLDGVFYDQYTAWLPTAIPKAVFDKLKQGINIGYKIPAARVSYRDWETVFVATQKPPVVKYFRINRPSIIKGIAIELSWLVEDASQVEIIGVGPVVLSGSVELKPTVDTEFRLKARSFLGDAEEIVAVVVYPTPLLHSLPVPMPDFASRLNLSPLVITAPKVEASIQFELRALSQTINPYKAMEPPNGTAHFTNGIRKIAWDSISKLYERFKIQLPD